MHGIARYKATQNATVSPQQIVMMLFQTAVHRLTRASQAENVGTSEWRADLHRVREILLELLGALDDRAAPALCPRLRSLYLWMLRETLRAGREKDARVLVPVLRATTEQLEAWQAVVYHGVRT